MATATAFRFDAATAPDALARLVRLRRLARLLDSAIGIPGTRFRFGLDGLFGLVPGGGDVVMGLVSLYIVNEARKMGLPQHKLLRMLGNVALDVAAGAVPVVGDLVDMAFKANLRNLDILEEHLKATGATR